MRGFSVKIIPLLDQSTCPTIGIGPRWSHAAPDCIFFFINLAPSGFFRKLRSEKFVPLYTYRVVKIAKSGKNR